MKNKPTQTNASGDDRECRETRSVERCEGSSRELRSVFQTVGLKIHVAKIIDLNNGDLFIIVAMQCSPLPNGWTYYAGERWPADPTNSTFDDVTAAATAPVPTGVFNMRYIILLICNYSRLSSLNSERFPEQGGPQIVAAPAYVWNTIDDPNTTIITTVPLDKWETCRGVGETLRSCANAASDKFHMVVDTANANWLADWCTRAMTTKITTGQIATDMVRGDIV